MGFATAKPVTASDAKPCPPGFKDYTGLKRGKLTVLGFSRRTRPKGKPGCTFWVCQCDCGNVWEVSTSNVGSRNVSMCASCGAKHGGERNRKHGYSGTKTYTRWKKLTGSNPDRLCERWRQFENFLEDMGECPDDKPCLHFPFHGEINKDSCFWSDRHQGAEPKHKDKNGNSITYQQMADELGTSKQRVQQKAAFAESRGVDPVDFIYGRVTVPRSTKGYEAVKSRTDAEMEKYLVEGITPWELDSTTEAFGLRLRLRNYVDTRGLGTIFTRVLDNFILIKFTPND